MTALLFWVVVIVLLASCVVGLVLDGIGIIFDPIERLIAWLAKERAARRIGK